MLRPSAHEIRPLLETSKLDNKPSSPTERKLKLPPIGSQIQAVPPESEEESSAGVSWDEVLRTGALPSSVFDSLDGADLDLAAICTATCELFCHLFHSSRGAVFIAEHQHGQLRRLAEFPALRDAPSMVTITPPTPPPVDPGISPSASPEPASHPDAKKTVVTLPPAHVWRAGEGIAGAVLLQSQPELLVATTQDPRWRESIDLPCGVGDVLVTFVLTTAVSRTGGFVNTPSALPIVTRPLTAPAIPSNVVGVVQLVCAEPGLPRASFASPSLIAPALLAGHPMDECNTIVSIAGRAAAHAVRRAVLFEQSSSNLRWNSILLQIARRIFEKLDSLEEVVTKIIVHAVDLLNCTRCSLFMVDRNTNELCARVFDADSETRPGQRAPEIRFPIGVGIAGHVALTGEILNIPDAYEDPRFNREVDRLTGFKTNNILCMPIFSPKNEVIGVAQLVNKASGPFDRRDEQLFEALAVYCGLGIHAVRMFEEARFNAYRAQVALDVLSYHSRATTEEVESLVGLGMPSGDPFGVTTTAFDGSVLTDEETAMATIGMFQHMGFIDRFRIPHQILCQWVLSVRKSYRNVTYHNWRHALGVAQSVFTMLQRTKDALKFTELEKLALFVGAICHDLDHRGTNNAFQGLTGNALSQLYTTSTMEHHHFDQSVMILNAEGNNIFCNLDGADYKAVISLLEQSILATDLAIHFKTRGTYRNLVDTGTFDWDNDKHRLLLMSMIMTASDLSAICKPFEQQKKTAEIVYMEFFEQGDAERKMGHNPTSIFNRSKVQSLPKMQLGFIDFVCLPVYDALARHFVALEHLPRVIRENRAKWEQLQGKFPPDDHPLTDPDAARRASVRQSVRMSVRQAPRVSTMNGPASLQLPPGATAPVPQTRLSVAGGPPHLAGHAPGHPSPSAGAGAGAGGTLGAPGPVRNSLVARAGAGTPLRQSLTAIAHAHTPVAHAALPRISTCSSASHAVSPSSPGDSHGPSHSASPASPRTATPAAVGSSPLAGGPAGSGAGSCRASVGGASVGLPAQSPSAPASPRPDTSSSSATHMALPRHRLSALRESLPPRTSKAMLVVASSSSPPEPARSSSPSPAPRARTPSPSPPPALAQDPPAAPPAAAAASATSSHVTLARPVAVKGVAAGPDTKSVLAVQAKAAVPTEEKNMPQRQGLVGRAARHLAPVSRSCVLM